MILVIFDCDGTLVDSQGMIVEAMNRTFLAHGMPEPAREDVLSIVGLTLDRAIAHILDREIDDHVQRLTASYKDAFHALRADPAFHEPLYPGASEAVGAIGARDDVLLGVATGKSRRGLGNVLDLHGLAGHFVTLQTADDAPSKPHPEMINRALRETGAAPERTIVVGDTSFDMEMASHAGATPIGVSWGYHPVERLAAAGAHRILNDFDELVPAIDTLFGSPAVPDQQNG